MENKKELRMIVDTFTFFYKKISGKQNFIFKNSDAISVMIHKFVIEFKELNKTNLLQKKAVDSYFSFQFNQLYTHSVNFDKNKSIQLNWIIGKTALEHWKKANKKHLNFIVRKNLKTFHDLRDTEKKTEDWSDLITKTNQIEEANKERFLNEENGFIYCQMMTNLYNHKSKNCLICDFSVECKQMLKVLYPKIYISRGYMVNK